MYSKRDRMHRALLMTEHDYRREQRSWGHDYVFSPIEGGKRGRAQGWGPRAAFMPLPKVGKIEAGDFLLLQNGEGETRYRVDSIEYHNNPEDMWSAEITFAPRLSK